MEMIVDAGHEVGAHGYLHENPVAMTPTQEEDVLVKSIELIKVADRKGPARLCGAVVGNVGLHRRAPAEARVQLRPFQGYRDFQPFYARVGDSWNTIDYTKRPRTGCTP
jgi:peptidoglycan-N-acetylglucosamine deacetylase